MERTHKPAKQRPAARRSFGWGHFMVGLMFVLAAALAFANPVGSLEAFTSVFAFLAIVNGIWMIAGRMGSVLKLAAGIFDILVGAFLFANAWQGVVALPYVFAVWFTVDCALRLANLGATRLLGRGYGILSAALNVAGIAVGVLLLFSPVTAALSLSFMVGLCLLLAGIECTAMAFSE